MCHSWEFTVDMLGWTGYITFNSITILRSWFFYHTTVSYHSLFSPWFQDLRRDNSPSVFTAKNGTLPHNLRCPETYSNNSNHHRGISTTSTNSSLHSNAKTSIFKEDHYSLSKSNSMQNLIPSIPSLSKSSIEKSIQSTPTWLDPQYFSALMRFLPSSLQFNKNLGVNLFSSETYGAFGETGNDFREISHNKGDGKVLGQRSSSLQIQPPPAAHFAIARCSPSLSRATSMLLEVRPLSQVRIQFAFICVSVL